MRSSPLPGTQAGHRHSRDCRYASAVNARGGFWYCTYQGGLNAEAFVSLLRPNDAASFEAGAFGARRTSRAQDHVGESVCCLHEGMLTLTFSSWLCA